MTLLLGLGLVGAAAVLVAFDVASGLARPGRYLPIPSAGIDGRRFSEAARTVAWALERHGRD